MGWVELSEFMTSVQGIGLIGECVCVNRCFSGL